MTNGEAIQRERDAKRDIQRAIKSEKDEKIFS